MSTSTKTGIPRLSPFKVILVCLVFLSCAAVRPTLANEFGIDLKSIPKIKDRVLLPEKEFQAKTKEVSDSAPYNDADVSYALRIPSDWTDNVQVPPVAGESSKSLLSDKVLGILGRYVGTPKNLVRSYVVVEAQTLSYEIRAQSWFINFILTNGFSLSALNEVSGQRVDAMYVQVIGDQTYLVRTLVQVNGPDLVMVRYYLPQENVEEERAMQEQVVRSFRLLKPNNERIEKQATYGFLDQSFFDYPASWVLKEKSILSVERMSALLLQQRVEGTGRRKRYILEGHIKINVISKLLKTTLPQEIQNFRAKLNIPKYKVGDLIEDIKYDYDPSIKNARAQVYKLVPTDSTNMQGYEILVTVMEGDDYYYITSMITPSREEDFYPWAQNMEAAKIINESIRRYNVPTGQDGSDPYYDYLKETR